MTKVIACPDCEGDGKARLEGVEAVLAGGPQKCERCKGSGEIPVEPDPPSEEPPKPPVQYVTKILLVDGQHTISTKEPVKNVIEAWRQALHYRREGLRTAHASGVGRP